MLRSCFTGRDFVLQMIGSDGCTMNVRNTTEAVKLDVTKRLHFMICVFYRNHKEKEDLAKWSND